jgi:hypothetical protein
MACCRIKIALRLIMNRLLAGITSVWLAGSPFIPKTSDIVGLRLVTRRKWLIFTTYKHTLIR